MSDLTKEWPALVKWTVLVWLNLSLLIWLWYYHVLGGASEEPGSDPRDEYEDLRQSLELGGSFNLRYVEWLSWALDKVDTFFDGGKPSDPTSLARRVGWQADGPTWTAASYNKCLEIAFVYPLATMFVLWVCSGHVGVAEKAFGLTEVEPADSGTWRYLFGAAIIVEVFAFWRFAQPSGWKAKVPWCVIAMCAIAVASFVGSIGAATGVGALAVAVAAARADSRTSVAVAAAVVGTVAVAATVFLAGANSLAGLVVLSGAFYVAVLFLSNYSRDRGRHSLFLGFFSIFAMLGCYNIVWLLPLSGWSRIGPLLVVFGLLTLVNAPFDWFAIGLTRWLLRKGLAWGGPWPYAFAIVDAALAAVSVTLLAFAAIVAVQTFGDIAVLRAGEDARIMSLGPLFEKLDDDPAAYENWWIWLMLFSTAIPSVVNLAIASFAFMRGMPFATNWMLRHMPEEGPMRSRDRLRVAAALSVQLSVGLRITAGLLYFLITEIIPLALPTLGPIIRDFSSQLAAYDAPRRAMKWLAGYR